MNFVWKILEIFADEGLIKQAKYHVTAVDGEKTVETEGNWSFGDPVLTIPFNEVTEEMVIDWIRNETVKFGENIVESRLKEQLEALSAPKVLPPWVPQVFSLGEK